MVGQIIQTKFLTEADYPEAAALSVILMVGMLVIALIYARALGHRGLDARGGCRMSAAVIDRASGDRALPRCGRSAGAGPRYILPVFTIAMIVYLASPVFIMILFSFNKLLGAAADREVHLLHVDVVGGDVRDPCAERGA